jgi:hypothetical protein
MSISDVLFEAREDILRYLKDDDGVYDRRRSEIAEVILAMDRLRLSNCPGAPRCPIEGACGGRPCALGEQKKAGAFRLEKDHDE